MLPMGIDAYDQPRGRRDCGSPNLPIALFDIALETSNPSKELPDGSEQHHQRESPESLLGLGGVAVEVGQGLEPQDASVQDAELKALFSMLNRLNKLGVKVLACQKVGLPEGLPRVGASSSPSSRPEVSSIGSPLL